jgi:hypothetical protein
VPRVLGERGRVGGGGGSYRRPGSPRRAGPREEARVRGRRGRTPARCGPEEGDDPRGPTCRQHKGEGGGAGRLGQLGCEALGRATD